MNILDLSKKELLDWLTERGFKKFTFAQIIQWLYQKRATSFDQMTNISKEARASLKENFEIHYLQVSERHLSPTDGSTKYLLKPKASTIMRAGCSGLLVTQIICLF